MITVLEVGNHIEEQNRIKDLRTMRLGSNALVSSFVYSRERFESDNFKDTISATVGSVGG